MSDWYRDDLSPPPGRLNAHVSWIASIVAVLVLAGMFFIFAGDDRPTVIDTSDKPATTGQSVRPERAVPRTQPRDLLFPPSESKR
jgi:hypothetical protein